MDHFFHVHQGIKLLNNKDSVSIRKALLHFREANILNEEYELVRPRVLYYLALGNYIIGQWQQAYRLLHKARRSIDIAATIVSMDNLSQKLGGNEIEELIVQIEKEYPECTINADVAIDDFDENYLDFSKVDTLFPAPSQELKLGKIQLAQLTDELLLAVFYGMCRENDQLIYFDIYNGDVLNYFKGRLISHINNDLNNSTYQNNDIQSEYIDETRFCLIDRLVFADFINEFKINCKGNRYHLDFIDEFSEYLAEEFSYYDDFSLESIYINNEYLSKFIKQFRLYSKDEYRSKQHDFNLILLQTQKTLSEFWVAEKLSN